ADADPASLQLARASLEPEWTVLAAPSAAVALELASQHDVAAVVLSDELELGVHALLPRLDALLPRSCVARIVTSHREPELVVDAQLGSAAPFYVLRRPLRQSELCQTVRRAVEAFELAVENERLTVELERVHGRLLRENA